MHPKSKLLNALSLVVILTMMLSSVNLPAASAQGSNGIQRDYNAGSGKITRITGKGNEPIALMGAMSWDMTSAERSDVLVEQFAPEFGLVEPSEELVVAEESQPESDRVVTKYQQVYEGVPVMGGELIVNASDTGALYSMNGEVAQGLALDTAPAISVETAIDIARQGMVKWYGGAKEDYQHSDASLQIFDESLLRPSTRPAELVWNMEMMPNDAGQPIRELVLVSAKTGSIPLHFNQIDTAWHDTKAQPIVEAQDEVPPTETPTPEPTETPLPIEIPVLESTPTPAELPLLIKPTPTGEEPSSVSSEGDVSALANTLYVDVATGSDSNTCTLALPCYSIQRAHNVAAAGDTVMVADGIYYRPASLNASPGVVILNKALTLSGGWKNGFTEQTGVSIVDGEYGVSGSYKNNVGFLITAGPSAIDHFIIQNSVSSNSGAIYLVGATLTITNSVLQNNYAQNNGAGIFGFTNSSLSLINSTIRGNVAGYQGGGIYAAEMNSLTIQNSTIVNNSARYGGGMFVFDSVAVKNFTNIILAKNQATFNGPDCNSTLLFNYSIVGNNANCTITGSNNHLNVDPGIAASATGNPPAYQLLFGSPAIDAGTSTGCPATDQQGHVRPYDGDKNGVATCDIGAYEFLKIPGVPASANIVSGNNQQAFENQNFANPLVVVVSDNMGDPVVGASVTFSAPTSGVSGTFASNGTDSETVTTDASGIATSSLFTANNEMGTYEVHASVDGLNTVLTFSMQNNAMPGVPHSVGPVSGNNQKQPINQPFGDPVAVRVLDFYGTPVNGAAVTFTAPATGPSAAFASSNSNTDLVNTNAEGIATSSIFTANGETGAYSILASTADVALPASFSLLNQFTPGIPTAIVAQVQTTHKQTINKVFADPLLVRIFDGNGVPVSGASVMFKAPASESSVTFASTGTNTETVSSNPDGYATSSLFTANSIPGSYEVEVSTVGFPVAIYFDLQNLHPVGIAKQIVFVDGNDQSGIPNYALHVPLKVRVLDEYSKPVRGVLVTFTVLADGANALFTNGTQTASAVSDSNGLAIAPALTPVNATGTFDLVVSADGAGEIRSIMIVHQSLALTYSGDKSNDLPGWHYLCNETNYPCTDYDLVANSAHHFGLGTVNMYQSRHNRNGIDGNNMPIVSTVHFCPKNGAGVAVCPYYNAFWSGSQMVYGDGYGFTKADDIVAHELTHGVTQYESRLFYFYQSGAIDESFADLWGEYYDQTNRQGNDTESVKWLLGEDATGLGAIRSMKNPPQFGDPDKMTSSLYNTKPVYDINWDYGGVHSNSGVNNKAAYLMVDGGTFNGKTVTALGWTKTLSIYYEAQSNLLSSGSDYSDLYYALQQACTNLLGQRGITSLDCAEVKDAADAVQMNSQPIPNFNPDAPMCPTGMTSSPAQMIFKDGFEDGTGNWHISGNWSHSSISASSGVYSIWGDDEATSNESILTMSPGITIPRGSTPFLRFKHAFAFEYYGPIYWDGGVLEYTTNTGATWLDAKWLFSAGENYPGHMVRSSGSSNELNGRAGFVGDSNGYVTSRYNLRPLAGKTVHFRWRFGTDQFFHYLGWFVDDVEIYSCSGTPSIPGTPSPAKGSLIRNYMPLLNWSNTSPASQYYHIQVDDAADFTSPIYDDNTLSVSQFQIPVELLPNKTYYWRVRSFNAVDGTRGWSPVWNFRTALLPPTITSPIDGFDSKELRPSLDWTAIPTASGYTVQLSKNIDFTQIVHTGSPKDSEYVPSVDLPKNTTLYWRVLAKGANGPSSYSEVRSFNTPLAPPPAPTLLTPASNALTSVTRPTFTWKLTGALPDHYIIQVDDNSSFSSPEIADNTVTLPTFTPIDDLNVNTLYYWRVRAVSAASELSNWSVVRTLRLSMLPPVLTSPDDAFTSKGLRPLFDWDAPGGPGAITSYTIQFSKNDTFTQIVHTGKPVTSEYVPSIDLPKGATLYWRVLAGGANGPSAYSDIRSLTIPLNPPPAPLLIAPANNVVITTYNNLSLKWKPVTFPDVSFKYYQVQVADNPAFSSPVLDDVTVTSRPTGQLLSSLTLNPNTKYFWRVRAVNTDDEVGNWSAVWTIRVAITPPYLTLPGDGEVNVSRMPLLDWENEPGNTGYILQIWKAGPKPILVKTVNLPTDVSQYQFVTALLRNTQYFWRVQTKSANGTSAWSAQPSFTVRP